MSDTPSPLEELERLKAEYDAAEKRPVHAKGSLSEFMDLRDALCDHADYLIAAAREREELRADAEQTGPYIAVMVPQLRYNPNYSDDRICTCGHQYYRHFDTYDEMCPVGCKYCECRAFEPLDAAIDAARKGDGG